MRNFKAGIIGGIVASIPYGFLLQSMGMMTVIAGMMGSSSIMVGWMVHMMIGVIFSVLFVVLFGSKVVSYTTGSIYGVFEGVVTWIIGPTVVMPMMMHMVPFSKIDLMSLVTHIMFGIVIGLMYHFVNTKNK